MINPLFPIFLDFNECNVIGTCHENATCKNTGGSYYCVCDQGFTGNGTNCTGISIRIHLLNILPTYSTNADLVTFSRLTPTYEISM